MNRNLFATDLDGFTRIRPWLARDLDHRRHSAAVIQFLRMHFGIVR